LAATVVALPGRLAAEEKKTSEAPPQEKVYTGKIVELKVEPATLELRDRLDARRLIVSGKSPEGNWVDLSGSAKYAIAPANDKSKDVAKIVQQDKDGFFQPIGDGAVTVTVSALGMSANVPIAVQQVAAPRPISYLRDVMPVLAKAGCNSGTCHGNPKGKNGFQLSLRGYEPDWDYEQLIEELSSRRFNRSRPHDSLMLLKPTQEVPHEGGLRFEFDSLYYRILHQWIVEGTQSDVGKTTRANGLVVLPEAPVLGEPGMTQQLLVIAKYPDGRTRDVTRDAVYSSSRDYVAAVGETGKIIGLRRGESAIVIRYEGNYAVNYVTVMGGRPGYQWVQQPANNYIDTLVYKKLEKMKILPSELCSDEEFLRRVYFDLIGMPPTSAEVRAFVADRTTTRVKRARVIDDLLSRPEFVDRWTHKWADLLQCNRKFLGEKGVWAFYNWIREAVAQNKPVDQFVREVLTASGSAIENPAAAYYRINRNPQSAVENVTQLFLGTRFSCNKCHDHPFERWTAVDYYGLAGYFGQVSLKASPHAGDEIVFDRRDAGEPVKHERTGQVYPPAFPFQHKGASPDSPVRREQLALWLTAPENPLFAKSIVNRFWGYFFGIGIIDPVDDIRSSNPPSNPELLDALTRDFVEHGFDLKHLLRTIVNSRVYQLSIKPNPFNEDDEVNFSRFIPRRLTAEQLQDAIAVAMEVETRYPGLPSGFRASQLPDTQVQAEFLDQFGRPPRESACECERVSEVSLRHTMSLINGPAIGDAIGDPHSRIAKLVKANPTDAALVEEIYLAVLCRRPAPAEIDAGLKYLKESPAKLEGAQDLAWALFNSPAFLFNR
jgi:hypothetical protein